MRGGAFDEYRNHEYRICGLETRMDGLETRMDAFANTSFKIMNDIKGMRESNRNDGVRPLRVGRSKAGLDNEFSVEVRGDMLAVSASAGSYWVPLVDLEEPMFMALVKKESSNE